MIRMTIAIFLTAIPFFASADNATSATGINFLGEWIYIGEAPIGKNEELVLAITWMSKTPEQFIFANECKYSESKTHPFYFNCRKDGKSPLAGATYKVTSIKNEDVCGESILYECISGCEPKRVPPRFDMSIGEC